MTASPNSIDLEVINEAITIIAGAQFCISQEEYALAFDGLPLGKKLSFLTSIKGLPVDSHVDIVTKAQELTPRHSGSTLPHSHGGSQCFLVYRYLQPYTTCRARTSRRTVLHFSRRVCVSV